MFRLKEVGQKARIAATIGAEQSLPTGRNGLMVVKPALLAHLIGSRARAVESHWCVMVMGLALWVFCRASAVQLYMFLSEYWKLMSQLHINNFVLLRAVTCFVLDASKHLP